MMRTVKIHFQSVEDIKKFVAKAENYSAELDIRYGNYTVDGKSILGLISMGICKIMDLVIYSDKSEDFIHNVDFCLVK